MTNDDQDHGQTQVLLALSRIEGKLAVIDERLSNLAKDSGDHEQRLRALEQRPAGITAKMLYSAMVGLTTVIGTVVSIVYYLGK